MSAASDAVIIGFNVRPVGDARSVAEREGVEIRTYTVIYRAIEELRAAMEGMLEPEEVEEALGEVEVRQLFRASRVGTIAGSYVTEGDAAAPRCRLVRRRHGGVRRPDRLAAPFQGGRARGVAQGAECGITLENYPDVKEGDVIEVYEAKQVEQTLA